MTDKKVIQEKVSEVVKLVDQIPTGVRVPSNWEAPKGFTLEKFMVDDIPVEHLIPDGGGNGKVIYQMHGGGFVLPLIDPYREVACQYSVIAGGAEVYSLDYHVAPTYAYPVAVDDCIRVYEHLLQNGRKPEDIIFAGDSAGGNLVLTVSLKLKSQNKPLPKGIVCISPYANTDYDFGTKKQNDEVDIILGVHGIALNSTLKSSSGYVSDVKTKDPFVNPVYGDFKGFPEILVQAGEIETLRGDADAVVEALKRDGVQVTYTVYPGMSHDFQCFIPDLEESQEAWKEIASFVHKKFF